MVKLPANKRCPKCAELGHDSSFDHLYLLDDKSGYICRQNGVYHEPYYEWISDRKSGILEFAEGIDEPNEYTTMTLDEVQKLPIAPLKARGIDKDICERYGVRVEYDTGNGEESGYYYPITEAGTIITYRNRVLPKRFSNVGQSIKGRKVELFGQTQCQKGGKKLLICGGQDDMLAACQMLWRKYPNFPPNVVSLTNGENTKSVADNLDFVTSFEEVLIYTDMDEVGRKCAEDIAKLVGPKAKIVETSEKDANDMLKKNKQAEFINAFFSAKEFAPEGFVTVDDVWDKATAMPTWGRPWPWPTLTKTTYGRRDGEGMYLGAGVKIGKSEFVNQLVHYCLMNGEEVGLFKLEEDPAMTVRKVAGKLKHKQFHIPDGDFTQDELIEGVQAVKNADLSMYGKYGTNRWEDIKPAIRHAAYKAKQKNKPLTIILDPLTRLVSSDPSVANKELTEISDDISKMAKDLNFFYLVCTHLNAPQTGKPHEEGGKVHSSQLTGSRAMMRTTYYLGGIERDKTAEDEVERNTSYFVLLEDRAFGNTCKFPIYYNRANGDYLEPTGGTNFDY